ncbi:hypothetical protein [Vibrio vulnificus]|uniref:hypothetical protein n=1 Tax=Vibrio vulnificus TaxID=672 RepID=UPI003E10E38F
MNKNTITPEKVTKPIQLLAAWFVALVVVNGSYLTAAQMITHPDWAAGLLVIAAVLNVPIFIGSLFVLQTKFRPQLQEDSYYSEYLNKYSQNLTNKNDSQNSKILEQERRKTASAILDAIKESNGSKEEKVIEVLQSSYVDELVLKYGGYRSLSELYKSPNTWRALLNKWDNNKDFFDDINELISANIVSCTNSNLETAKLTELGKAVAIAAEERSKLWYQTHPSYWEEERTNFGM